MTGFLRVPGNRVSSCQTEMEGFKRGSRGFHMHAPRSSSICKFGDRCALQRVGGDIFCCGGCNRPLLVHSHPGVGRWSIESIEALARSKLVSNW